MDKELELAILKDKEYRYKTFYSPKAILLTIITLGFYRGIKCMDYMRIVGLY